MGAKTRACMIMCTTYIQQPIINIIVSGITTYHIHHPHLLHLDLSQEAVDVFNLLSFLMEATRCANRMPADIPSPEFEDGGMGHGLMVMGGALELELQLEGGRGEGLCSKLGVAPGVFSAPSELVESYRCRCCVWTCC